MVFTELLEWLVTEGFGNRHNNTVCLVFFFKETILTNKQRKEIKFPWKPNERVKKILQNKHQASRKAKKRSQPQSSPVLKKSHGQNQCYSSSVRKQERARMH